MAQSSLLCCFFRYPVGDSPRSYRAGSRRSYRAPTRQVYDLVGFEFPIDESRALELEDASALRTGTGTVGTFVTSRGSGLLAGVQVAVARGWLRG